MVVFIIYTHNGSTLYFQAQKEGLLTEIKYFVLQGNDNNF